MKAGECNLQKILNGAVQFQVPIYQRKYSWKEEQCKQLWEDILKISEKEGQTHFIGSIVYIDMGIPLGRPQQFSLIDGQQRLTTLSLLLCALMRYVEDNKLEDRVCKPSKIMNYYLYNADESGMDRYKLVLTDQDRDTYITLLGRKEDNLLQKSWNILDNFNYFMKRLSSNPEKIEAVFRGINQLMLVSISLDKTQDNPQLIFESMNSTGKDLTQSDLIRNYVLMGHPKERQEYLYKNYWLPMEKLFGAENYEKYFDLFIRDFLTSQSNSGKIPKIGDVYHSFKEYLNYFPKSIEEILKQIFQYSKYYSAIQLGKEKDEDLKTIWKKMKIIDMDVSFPFLLRVYDDYTDDLIKKNEFIKILEMTISYVVRRSICDIPTNSLNKTFGTFYQNIDKANYVKSVSLEYATKETYREFPKDKDFMERFKMKDIYRMKIKNYILESLENYNHKEPISISEFGYSIEHIMPQDKNLSDKWIAMLGNNYQDVQNKYMHTIGNLTITGYNSEMGNRDFIYKRDSEKGFKNSHLMLNKDIAVLNKWNEESIRSRAAKLAQRAIQIWKYPEVSNEEVNIYIENKMIKNKSYSMKDYTSMSEGIEEIFKEIEDYIMGQEMTTKDFNKYYISYKISGYSYVNIKPAKNYIILALNIPFNKVDDPKGYCMDYRDKGNFASCDTLIELDENMDVEQVKNLIREAYFYQKRGKKLECN
jgi:uncharacterized protein with ParB-like and HNH nuclease domain/predicted transport protein